MVRVAGWSFFGGGIAGSCDDDGARTLPAWHIRWHSTTGYHASPVHQPNHLVAVTMAADLKYYELYRRSRYCMRACKYYTEHAR